MPRVAMSSLGGGARSALTAGQKNESWRALQEDAVAGQSSSSDSSAPASLEHAELPRHSTVSRVKKTMVKAPLGTLANEQKEYERTLAAARVARAGQRAARDKSRPSIFVAARQRRAAAPAPARPSTVPAPPKAKPGSPKEQAGVAVRGGRGYTLLGGKARTGTINYGGDSADVYQGALKKIRTQQKLKKQETRRGQLAEPPSPASPGRKKTALHFQSALRKIATTRKLTNLLTKEASRDLSAFGKELSGRGSAASATSDADDESVGGLLDDGSLGGRSVDFSDADSEIEHLLEDGEGATTYRSVCEQHRTLPSSRAVVSIGNGNVDVRGGQLGDRGMLPLAAAFSSATAARVLRLQQNGLGPAGINALAAGIAEGGGASLDEVDVSCNGKLGDRALAGFVKALGLHCGVLRAVALANTGAGDLTAGELGGSFRRHAKLELVDVSGNRVTAAGVEALAPLLRAAGDERRGAVDGGLAVLHASWNQFGDAGALLVAAPALASPTGALAALDLSYNQLGDAAGVALAPVLARSVAANSTLKILDASRNRLGAFAAGEFAAAVAGCRKLQVLKLGWNPLGTEGALLVVKAVGRAPAEGRAVSPASLHSLRLENTCKCGEEHRLHEAVESVSSSLARLNRSAPTIVVEFPDRNRRINDEAVFNYENDFNLVDRMFAETAKRVKLDKARRAKQAESAIVKSDRSSQARKGFKKAAGAILSSMALAKESDRPTLAKAITDPYALYDMKQQELAAERLLAKLGSSIAHDGDGARQRVKQFLESHPQLLAHEFAAMTELPRGVRRDPVLPDGAARGAALSTNTATALRRMTVDRARKAAQTQKKLREERALAWASADAETRRELGENSPFAPGPKSPRPPPPAEERAFAPLEPFRPVAMKRMKSDLASPARPSFARANSYDHASVPRPGSPPAKKAGGAAGMSPRLASQFHRNASAIMKRGDHLQVLDGLQSFNRRKDESSYFEQDQADLNFRNDWEKVAVRDAVLDALGARPVQPTSPKSPKASPFAKPDFVKGASMEDVAAAYEKMQFSTSADGRVTMSKMSKKKPSMRAEKRPPHPAVVAVEAALRKHHGRLRRVFRHGCAAFPASDAASPTRLGRRGWHELLDALGLVDRRRVCANAAAGDRVRPLRARPAGRRRARRARDAEDRAVLDAADFCGALVVYVAGMVASRPARDDAGGVGDAVDVVLGGGLDALASRRPRALIDADLFRRHALYSPQVDAVLKSHQSKVNALFSYYTRRHDSVLLTVAGWLGLLRDAALIRGDVRPAHNAPAEGDEGAKRAHLPKRAYDGDFTVSDARLVFAWARVPPPESNAKAKKAKAGVRATQSKVKPTSADSLTRIDFTEALCWLALLKPLPGKDALLHGTWEAEGLSLHEFFEIADEPAIANHPQMHALVDAPRPPPATITECHRVRLEEDLLKVLAVLYRRIPRTNPDLAAICGEGMAVAARQLDDLAKHIESKVDAQRAAGDDRAPHDRGSFIFKK
ncbi:hypothetical protein SO694_00047042 [Aureococcus anophagefferens]|uniref:Uncharacterized protein n=1 Tax=Aureococcus anophagefferens TaxID=44056 RepID=A0ABR1G899_AURAN